MPTVVIANIGISVIIPTYNRGKTIGYALRTVLEQTYPVNEIIIVDDCSTDDTVSQITIIDDPRVRVIIQSENKGAQAARNRGLREAKNKWVALHDSDDEWLPNRIELGVAALNAVEFEQLTLVHGNCIKYYELTEEKIFWALPVMAGNSAEVLPKVLKEPGPMFQGMLTNIAAFEKIGWLDESVPAYQEWDTAIRLAKVCRFVHIEQPLFLYHFHEGAAISKEKNNDIIGYHFNRLKHKDDTIAQLGKPFFDENVRWNVERAFDRRDFRLAKKLIKDTYRPSTGSYIYLFLLAQLGITPKQIRKVLSWLLFPLRRIKRWIGK